MAMKKKEVELKEVSRTEVNGTIIIKYEDGSVKIIPAPITLSAEDAEDLFGSESEEEDDEDDSDEDEDESEDEDEDDSDDEEEEDEESEDDEDEEEDDEEDLTGEALAEMDFEELEEVCDDKDLDTDLYAPPFFQNYTVYYKSHYIIKEIYIKAEIFHKFCEKSIPLTLMFNNYPLHFKLYIEYIICLLYTSIHAITQPIVIPAPVNPKNALDAPAV